MARGFILADPGSNYSRGEAETVIQYDSNSRFRANTITVTGIRVMSDTGSWEVQKNRLCMAWDKLKENDSCVNLSRRGDFYAIYTEDGRRYFDLQIPVP